MVMDLRLPLRIRQTGEAIAVEDAEGTTIFYAYYDDGEPIRRRVRKRMTRAQAEEVAKVCARALTKVLEGGEVEPKTADLD